MVFDWFLKVLFPLQEVSSFLKMMILMLRQFSALHLVVETDTFFIPLHVKSLSGKTHISAQIVIDILGIREISMKMNMNLLVSLKVQYQI